MQEKAQLKRLLGEALGEIRTDSKAVFAGPHLDVTRAIAHCSRIAKAIALQRGLNDVILPSHSNEDTLIRRVARQRKQVNRG